MERRCLLRSTAASDKEPAAAADCLWKARAYSHGLRNREHGFGVFGGVCVTSTTSSRLPGGKPERPKFGPQYPAGGFLASQEFQPFGGVEQLFGMFHECPANVHAHEIASCAGDIYQWPESPETEAQLRGIVSRLGLQREVDECFPATRPLWFGLWAVSPVPKSSLPVLRTLLSEILAEDQRDMAAAGKVDHDHLRQFATLVAAIERAESSGIPLHVELLPLGHTDFGIYTIFPHCPFCKATARVGRWQRKYPSELHTCAVCGTRFSPAETGSAKRMDWERHELSEIMGEAAFREFAASYLVERGEPPERAAAIVEATEADEVRRKEMNRQRAELEKRRSEFVQQHLYAGLDCLAAPPPEFPPDENDEPEPPAASTGWFDAKNMAEVLRRCEQRGIKVTFMQHHSADGDMDRFEMKYIKAPLDLLAKWEAEGCREKFCANCRVPDSLVTTNCQSESPTKLNPNHHHSSRPPTPHCSRI